MEGKLNYTGYVYADTLTGNIIHGCKGQTIYSEVAAVKRSMLHSYELRNLVRDEWLERNGHGKLNLERDKSKEALKEVEHLKYDDPSRSIVQNHYYSVNTARAKAFRDMSRSDEKTLRKELTGKGGRFKIMKVKCIELSDPEEE